MFEGGPEPDPLDRLDKLRDADLRGIKCYARLLVPETHVGPADALEPFQGSFDRKRSAPSGHALDRQHGGRGRSKRHMHGQEQHHDGQPWPQPPAHLLSFVSMPFMSWPGMP